MSAERRMRSCLPRSLLKILVFLFGCGMTVCVARGIGVPGCYASAQVPSVVRVSPRLVSRRRLRAAARLWSQMPLLVMPR
jgi:hypothetical protein